MKTLAQLRPRHDTIRWMHESIAFAIIQRLGAPDYYHQAHNNGPHYFSWHEECYSHRDLHRPAFSPATRRPVHECENVKAFRSWKGKTHHRFKKLSSRRLRKALKRELNDDLAEAYMYFDNERFFRSRRY